MTDLPIRLPGEAPEWGCSPLHAALNAEWNRAWAACLAPAPTDWAADPTLQSFTYAGDVLVALDGAATPKTADAILHALCARAQAGDAVAARIAVQYLIPFAVRLAFTANLRRGRRRGEVFDDLISALWDAVASPVRNGSGAPLQVKLLRRAEYAVLRRPARRLRFEVPDRHGADPEADLDGRPAGAGIPAGEELVLVLADAVGRGLPEADARLLGELYVAGRTQREVSEQTGVCVRKVRDLHAVARRRLAEVVA